MGQTHLDQEAKIALAQRDEWCDRCGVSLGLSERPRRIGAKNEWQDRWLCDWCGTKYDPVAEAHHERFVRQEVARERAAFAIRSSRTSPTGA